LRLLAQTTAAGLPLRGAWQLTSGTYVEQSYPLCAPGVFGKVEHGQVTKLSSAMPRGNVVAASTSELLLNTVTCTQAIGSLEWVNPATRTVVHVLAADDGEGVTSTGSVLRAHQPELAVTALMGQRTEARAEAGLHLRGVPESCARNCSRSCRCLSGCLTIAATVPGL